MESLRTAVSVRLLLQVVVVRPKRLAGRTRSGLDDAGVSIVARTQWVLLVLGSCAGGRFLALPKVADDGSGTSRAWS